MRHGQAKNIHVSLHLGNDGVHLGVSDDGRGFDSSEAKLGPGLGLISMRERTRLIGGECTIQSKPGRGTRIDARIPLSGVRW